MKKFFKIIRNVIVGAFLLVYFSFIILVSTLLLNRNDYGVPQFKDKVIIAIDETIANDKYPKGSLVIVENKTMSELNLGEEIFVYQRDKRDDTVQIVIANIKDKVTDVNSPYVILKNEGTAWGEEFIAGTTYKIYDDLGSIFLFITSKWVFFSVLIVPCFFILLYEIYLVIVTLKFGDIDDEEEFEEEIANKEKSYKEKINSQDEKIEELMKQINELKKEQTTKTTKKTPKKSK